MGWGDHRENLLAAQHEAQRAVEILESIDWTRSLRPLVDVARAEAHLELARAHLHIAEERKH